jgi:hypothetical protein
MRLTSKLRHAAEEALGRRDRTRHPDGAWDRGGRWYPAHVAAERGYPVTTLRVAVKRIEDEITQG